MRHANWKRWACGFLAGCCCIALSACGRGGTLSGTAASASSAGSGVGRWVETELTPDETEPISYLCAPVPCADGKLLLYATCPYSETPDAVFAYVSADGGKTFEKQPTGWQETTGGRLLFADAMQDGTCLFATAENDAETRLWHTDASGKLSEIALPAGTYVRGATCFDNETALLRVSVPVSETAGSPDNTYMRGDTECTDVPMLLAFSTGKLSDVEFSFPNFYAPVRDGNGGLYYPSGEGSGLALDILSTKGHASCAFSGLSAEDTGIAGAADSEGNYCYATAKGIFRVAKGGTISEQLLNAAGMQLGLAQYTLSGLTATAGGDYLVWAQCASGDTVSDRLFCYHFDESMPAAGENTLVVWSDKDNPTVRAAIAEFSKSHPDITVDYQVSDLAGADAVQGLNAAMLAGSGPDILLLDDLDYAAYAKQGLLSDLSGCIDTSLLAQNIAAPFIGADGAIYTMPARFSVPLLFGDAGDLAGVDSLDTLLAAVKACPARPDLHSTEGLQNELAPDERYALTFSNYPELIRFMLQTSWPALLHDGQLDTDALRQILSFTSGVASHYGMNDYRRDSESNAQKIGTYTGEMVSMGNGGFEYSVYSRARYGWCDMLTPSFLSVTPRYEKGLESDAEVQPGVCEGVYIPSAMIGVNAAGTKQDAAMDFVRAMFSEAVQNTYQEDGCPVLQTALTAAMEKNRANNVSQGYTGDMDALFAGLKTPVTLPAIDYAAVENTLIKHTWAIVDETETLDAGVTGVQDDLSLYLSEKAQ